MSDLILQRENKIQTCDNWSTPDWLFRWAQSQWGPFSVDLAADATNHKCARWYGKGGTDGTDGLRSVADGTAWCNPPFSDIAPWVGLCAQRPAVMLLPANRTEQAWWGHAVNWATEIVWLSPRIAYDDPLDDRTSPKFASVFMLFGLYRKEQAQKYRQANVHPRWERVLL